MDEGADVAAETEEGVVTGGRRRSVLWTSVAVGLVVTLLIAVLATRPSATTRAVRSPLLGTAAPQFEAETIDGGQARLADSRGRWVLLNFFATWCVPCRQEHPDLVRFAARHAPSGDIDLVGVVYDDRAAAVREYRRANGGTWPMLTDPRGTIALDYGVSGVPESFLISPGGVVVSKLVGGVRAEQLERLLRAAQAGA